VLAGGDGPGHGGGHGLLRWAFLAAGQAVAYRSQLLAFGDQARDLSPRWITSVAAASLEKEADRLAGM
jgi:hypothetical protein